MISFINNQFSKGLFLVFLLFFSGMLFANDESGISVDKPLIIMSGMETQLGIHFPDTVSQAIIHVNGQEMVLDVKEGMASFPMVFQEETSLFIQSQYGEIHTIVSPIPLWLSIFPPLIAILVALILKEVFTALFMGIFVGTFTIYFYHGVGFFAALYKGLLSLIDHYVINALNNTGHLSIIVFSMLIGGMVFVITRNGGMRGIVNFLSRYAKTRKSGQFVAWLLGVAIFFDDYANTLVVGNTMRPVTDRLKISREKLAYIVDSTAAPVASVALITTWIGAELSYIQDGIRMLNLDETPYIVFLHSLKYSFYPIFTLGFIIMLIYMGRDFGPMKTAEKRAALALDTGVEKEANDQDFQPKEGITPKAYNALIPVLVVVLGTIGGLIATGLEEVVWDHSLSFGFNLSLIIGHADSYRALLWSSLGGSITAILMSVGQGLLSLKESMDSLLNGLKVMLTAVIILTLAWSLAGITEDLQTAQFISGSLISLKVSPFLVPGLAFVLAAIVAFSTGSSWGTMAILYPLMLPASWMLSTSAGLAYDESLSLFHNVVSVILAGSVLGDHCSPISDTTIMSSLASQCNHIEHVRTQLPYALTVGFVSLVIGTISVAYGLPVILGFVLGFFVLFLIIRYLGIKTLS